MATRPPLLTTPPYAVETALQTLGANLRTARLRRGLTIEEMGQKVGVGRRAVMDAEKGKPATAIGIYVGLLWALDLIEQLDAVAAPARDEVGLALTPAKTRARRKGALDNDF
jgi:transcriptional regulator with XRE-family HTH domain